MTTLHWVDWAVFAAALVLSSAIGLYYAFTGGKQRTTKEYLHGNRKLQVLPVALSTFMTVMSAIMVLGTTAEMYTHGTQNLINNVGHVIGYVLTAFIFVPLFYPLKLTSVYQYVDLRFRSRRLHLFCVAISVLGQISYMGLALYAPATALEGATGFPVWGSILIAGVVTTLYTSLGGIKAVVWTDVFQSFVMMGGILTVLILGTTRVGGLGRVLEISMEGQRISFFDMDINPTKRLTFWSALIRGILFTFTHGANQMFLQRYGAVQSLKKAKCVMLLNALFGLVLAALLGLCGLVMYAYFTELGCDPLGGRLIFNSTQLLPYLIGNVFNYPGLSGLFFAVLFCGALSSLSSNLNSLAAVIWKDLFESRFKERKEEFKTFVNKILVVIFGIVAMGMSFFMEILSGHVIQIANRVLGALSAPSSGTMILGALFPFSNSIGCIAGSVASFCLTVWMNVGNYLTIPHQYRLPTVVTNCTFSGNQTALPNPTDPPPESIFALYRVSFMWVPIIALLTVVIVGLVVSVLTGGCDVKDVRPDLVVPLCDFMCCCCKRSVRRALWCGIGDNKSSGKVTN